MDITANDYKKFLQCQKLFWLNKINQKKEKKEFSKQKQYFKKYVKDTFRQRNCFQIDTSDIKKACFMTAELINSDTEIIFDATFCFDGFYAMVDVFDIKNKIIYKIKPSSYPKQGYIETFRYSYYIISKFIDIEKCNFIHLNKKYTRAGELNRDEFLVISDVTKQVKYKNEVLSEKLSVMKQTLNSQKAPNVSIGKHCNEPYECEYKSICWEHIPKDSIFDITYTMGKHWELYEQGIYKIDEIPDDFNLSKKAKEQIELHKANSIKIDKENIQKFIKKLVFPINFLDFETFSSIMPRFDNQKPFEQIPFQYSLHILYEDGRLEHKEFLADENDDPREDVAKNLLQDITKEGSIVAFNKSFEISMIKKLARQTSYKDELLELVKRFEDIAHPFQSRYYYDPKFNGRYSLKVLLPVLFPENSELHYENLSLVKHGGDAAEIYGSLYMEDDEKFKQDVKEALLKYCHLDTLAMVMIYKKLKEVTV